MACILRISGRALDIDGLLKSAKLTGHGALRKVYRRGEPRFPASQPKGPRNQYSGVNICISDTGFDEFEKMKRQAVRSLRRNRKLLKKLVSYKGVDGAVLDFGINWRECVAQFDRLPAELVSLAGQIGLALEISHYPVSKRKTKQRKRS